MNTATKTVLTITTLLFALAVMFVFTLGLRFGFALLTRPDSLVWYNACQADSSAILTQAPDGTFAQECVQS